MRTRFLIVISVVVLATGACGASRNGSDRSRSIRPETLLLATGEGPLSLRAPSGAVVFERAGGVPSPDGSLVFSTSQVGRATRLDAADARTGGIFESSRVPGHLAVRAVSESGDEVALMAPLPLGWDPWTPRPRSRTTIVVADPSGTLEPKTFHLSGNFEPEAFSTDDGRLFMIQYLPPEAPSVYRVTVLDLAHGSVDPVFGPYKGPTERMPGTRLEQVRAPDGSQLYTLYTSERPGYAPHGAPVARNAVVSFVHVLSLTDGWAHCVGLPKPFWHRPASAEALATSPDGSKLYVVDTGIGMATVLDTSSSRSWTPRRSELGCPTRVERPPWSRAMDPRCWWVPGPPCSRSTRPRCAWIGASKSPAASPASASRATGPSCTWRRATGSRSSIRRRGPGSASCLSRVRHRSCK